MLRLKALDALAAKHFDIDSRLKAYEAIFEQSSIVQEWASAAGLERYAELGIKRQLSSQAKSRNQWYYLLFCCLISELSQNGQGQLVDRCITGLVQHYLPTLFPKESIQKAKPDPEKLRRALAHRLHIHWKIPVHIKESFHTEGDHVRFALIAHSPQHSPVVIQRYEGKRLKPTRSKAYQLCEKAFEAHIFPAKPALLTG